MTLFAVPRQPAVRRTHNSSYKRAVTVCFTWCSVDKGLTKLAYGLRRKREKISRQFEAALREVTKYQERCRTLSGYPNDAFHDFPRDWIQSKQRAEFALSRSREFFRRNNSHRLLKMPETISLCDQTNLGSNSRYPSDEILHRLPLDIYRIFFCLLAIRTNYM
jgi:hypothetical protein